MTLAACYQLAQSVVKAKPPLINFELILFTRNETSQLGQSVYVVTRPCCEQFPGERAIPWMFYFGVFVAAVATVYQELHFWT